MPRSVGDRLCRLRDLFWFDRVGLQRIEQARAAPGRFDFHMQKLHGLNFSNHVVSACRQRVDLAFIECAPALATGLGVDKVHSRAVTATVSATRCLQLWKIEKNAGISTCQKLIWSPWLQISLPGPSQAFCVTFLDSIRLVYSQDCGGYTPDHSTTLRSTKIDIGKFQLFAKIDLWQAGDYWGDSALFISSKTISFDRKTHSENQWFDCETQTPLKLNSP